MNCEIFLNTNAIVYIEDDGQEVVVTGSDEQLTNEANLELAETIEAEAVRINHDVNGNPFYYISCIEICVAKCKFIRPAFADKYRGNKYGSG